MTTLLKVQDLGKGFAPKSASAPVLSDVSFSIQAGEIWAIIGRSGSGKSALLKILSGLDRASSGTLEWSAGAKFELVTPDSGLRDGKSTHFGLKPLLGPNVATLPRGELHRLRVEQALARKPDVLLLDEPFSAMDPGSRARVRSWLHAYVASQKRAVVIATQELEEALRLGARTILLDKGEIHQLGEASDLYRDPESRAVARACGFNFLDGRLDPGSGAVDGGPVFAFAEGDSERMLPLRFLHSVPAVPGAEPGRGSLTLGSRPETIRVARSPEQLGRMGVQEIAVPSETILPGFSTDGAPESPPWEAPWLADRRTMRERGMPGGVEGDFEDGLEGHALRWIARVARMEPTGRDSRLIAEVGSGLWEIVVPASCDLRAGERCWLELDRESICWFDAQGARLRMAGDGEAAEPLPTLALEDEAGTRGLKTGRELGSEPVRAGEGAREKKSGK